SSRDHFNDDAVWASSGSLIWTDIYEPPRYNEFNGSMNLAGQFVGGGTNYYGQGWYFYENTNWWNIWFYDNPFTTEHVKQSNIAFRVLPFDPTQPSVVSVTINWSTSAWSSEGNPPGTPRRPPVPPLTSADEALYVGRQIPPLWQWPGGVLPPEGEPVALPHTISYNPEWVSIDVSGSNFIIQKGMINHECVRTSLDLAFVITGPAICPLPTITPECTALQARDCQILDLTNENCLPKVIRHNTAQVFFPPTAGTDTLKPTTGYVTIMDPSGGIETYTIRESPPNLTRVRREEAVDVGGWRTVQTEIVEMELIAGGGGGGGAAVMIRESPTRASSGGVVGAVSATTDYPAESFFDLFVEVDLPDLGVYGLYNDAAIELKAHGITAMPPLGSSFMTPATWQPVELLYAGGTTGSGYFIVEVIHDLPPPPPEWEVTVCDCIDPGACRVTQEFSITPTCTGGCPGTQVCTQRITTGFGTVDYSCECVVPTGACCPLSGPSPDCLVTTEADCL
ncbi:MAG: hypothetical protein Q7R41_12230, partial [Phycisphaerales bacterium]|nr:hypothetical protein [Phycisphaerales bacterium]